MNRTVFNLLLALREGPRQAGAILERMADLGEQPSLAAFYRLLKSTLDERWIEIVGSETGGPGRPRQIYALTQAGAHAIEKEARQLQALAALALGGEA